MGASERRREHWGEGRQPQEHSCYPQPAIPLFSLSSVPEGPGAAGAGTRVMPDARVNFYMRLSEQNDLLESRAVPQAHLKETTGGLSEQGSSVGEALDPSTVSCLQVLASLQPRLHRDRRGCQLPDGQGRRLLRTQEQTGRNKTLPQRNLIKSERNRVSTSTKYFYSYVSQLVRLTGGKN